MTIDPVGQSAYTTMTIPTPVETPDESDGVQETAVVNEPDTSASAQDEIIGATDEQVGNESGKMKGVLRLLQAGHFHGVADVRLRINFQDEIAAMEHRQFTQTAQQGLTDLQAAIDTQAAALLDNPELEAASATGVNDALAAFDFTLAQHASETTGNTSALTDQIRADFDNLVSSLKTALGVDAESNPETSTDDVTVAEDIPESAPQMAASADGPPAATPETAPATDYQTFIDDLISTFETKLQELETSLTDINVLPELSAPHGNGKAYDKFVAMYNDMRTPPAEVMTPEPAVDTSA